jgi:hypothetical protein
MFMCGDPVDFCTDREFVKLGLGELRICDLNGIRVTLLSARVLFQATFSVYWSPTGDSELQRSHMVQ